MTDQPDQKDLERAFQQRFDLARLFLEREYRWARSILRNLTPTFRPGGGLFAVDQYLRLYWGTGSLDITDAEFAGALWHEVHHLMRRHHGRLEPYIRSRPDVPPLLANLATDIEINDDLLQNGVPLPVGVFVSPEVQQWLQEKGQPGFNTVDVTETGELAEYNWGRIVDEWEKQQEQQQQEGQQGDGQGDQQGQSGGVPGEQDLPNCGSAAGGGDQEGEEGPPDPQQQHQAERAMRKADDDLLDESEKSPGGTAPGATPAMVQAAIERKGKSKHDWRQTLATEVRTAMEQRADEAEEFSFKRRSRRAASFDEVLLPGMFRPIPHLAVVVDVSGSMDEEKLTAAMREVHGILERLAIPEFTALPTDTRVIAEVPILQPSDVARVFEHTGGGTNMMVGLERAVQLGAEVVIILTDAECHWAERGPFGIPVIVGGINRGRRKVPKWARLVDVERVE